MKKIQSWILCSLFFSQAAFAGGPFDLEDLHEAAREGIKTFLEGSNKTEDAIKGYAVGKKDNGAHLIIYLYNEPQVDLSCHFHGGHGEIDCH